MGVLQPFMLPTIPSRSWDFMMIEDSHFKDAVWDLRSLFANKRSNVHSQRRLNFALLASKPLVIEPIKRYCYLRLGQIKPISVVNAYNGLATKLIRFMHHYEMDSLEAFNTKRFMTFNLWLKTEYANQTVSNANNLARVANTLYQIIKMGQALGFSGLPKESIILEISIWQWWDHSTGRKSVPEKIVDRSIPLPIWKEIIQKAWSEPDITQTIRSGSSEGLFRVNNVRFALLIQAFTGLRISEVLYLKRGCVHKDSKDRCWLDVSIEKTEQLPTLHQILIPKDIYTLVEELHTLTQPLEEEAKEKEYLFYILSRPYKRSAYTTSSKRFIPVPLESGKYNSNLLHPFLKRNDLPTIYKNSENETITLTSHSFRHTFANIAVAQKGIDPTVLQTHFRHLSLEMTLHYVHLHKNELKKSYIKGMMEGGNIYTQGKEGDSFKKILNEATGVRDLNQSTERISKMFGINPLPFGLCLYDFKRGHCPHLGVQSCHMIGCSDFITNTSFLPNFKHEQELLIKQLDHVQKSGYIIEAKKTQFHLHKIETIINSIKKDGHG